MADIGGVPQPVFVRSFGTGPRKALALHCTIAHSGAWRPLASEMENEVTLVTPDMLSHGRSPDWDGQGDFQDRGVEAVEHLLTGPMDVIGHSFGATIALRLAVAYPHLVRSLTMIEPVYFAVAQLDAPELVKEHDAQAAPFLEALETGDNALAARRFNQAWGNADSPRWPDLPQTTRDAMTRSIHVLPACRPSLFDDRPGMLKPGVLGQLQMPTLLLRGSTSYPIVGVTNDGLARRLGNAESLTIPGAGHMLPMTHPAQMATHLRSLFARC